MDNSIIQSIINTKADVTFDVVARNICQFRSGGKLKYVIQPKSAKMLKEVIDLLITNNIEYRIIGNCSNVIISDNGYNGVIVRTNKLTKILFNNNIVEFGCGVSLQQAIKKTTDRSLAGLEWFFGVPASIGGAVYQNAGCYGHSISDNLISVVAVADGKLIELSKEECNFAYRYSGFMKNKYAIVSAKFNLEEADYFTLMAKMDAYRRRRLNTQPLNYPSVGCTFKRVNDKSIAQYIEKYDLKGMCVGGAQVSTKHCGFIVNKGLATTEDYLVLARLVQKEIYDKEGIFFPLEIEYIGEETTLVKRLKCEKIIL